MRKHPQLTERRIHRFIERILEDCLYPESIPLEIAAFHVDGEPVPPEVALRADYEPFDLADKWGTLWGTTWFRFRLTIPENWKGQRVVGRVMLRGAYKGVVAGEGFMREGLAFVDGKPVSAINVNRQDVPLTDRAQGGETLEFYVEAGANPKVDGGGNTPDLVMPEPDGPRLFELGQAVGAIFDPEAWDLYHDFWATTAALDFMPGKPLRRGQLRYALNAAINVFHREDRTTWAGAQEILREVMAKRNGDTVLQLSAVGHAHIDTAWLWPLRETIRKCARTFATALSNMERYPEYTFVCSQAIQYAWMKAHYPTIWEGIQKAVKRGQWEPVGSSWIEADCNIPSGESLVRQIAHGKRFFQEEFDYETKDMWIPDVFGYSANFPQILRKTGIDYFLTQKISWNDTNQFPHHTFYWEGIDGSRVFTHFPPANTYNSDMSPREFRTAEDRFLDADRATRALYVYGYGDGGGGPTRAQLERARRYQDFEGLPTVTLEKALDFFPKAEEDIKHPAVWIGELYLEKHRGTYTSQSRTKRANRRGERLLREAEMADALCFALGIEPGNRPNILQKEPERAVYDIDLYPDQVARNGRAAALDRAWKLLLLNQFHDIIPGSSIHWVYLDAQRDAEVIFELARRVRDDALADLATRLDGTDFESPAVLLNTVGTDQIEDITRLPDGTAVVHSAPAASVSVVPGLTEATPAPTAGEEVRLLREPEHYILENGRIRVVVTHEGELASVFDKTLSREALAEGETGNQLHLLPDYPTVYDAWEIEQHSFENERLLSGAESVEVETESPLCVALRVVRRFGKSEFEQRIVLRSGSPRIDFETRVEWQERRTLLKVAFPVEVRSPEARYEIQYGHVGRPTHTNTSWDEARFEVCAQKWADLSEPGLGVSILNDCKYGHDIFGNQMRLTLLKGAMAPDPKADLGEHQFTYSLLIHDGQSLRSTIAEAYALNFPLVRREIAPSGIDGTQALQLITDPARDLELEAMKVADDGKAVIVRYYEPLGARGIASLRLHQPAKKVHLADLLENPLTELPVENHVVALPFQPFEILTLRIEF